MPGLRRAAVEPTPYGMVRQSDEVKVVDPMIGNPGEDAAMAKPGPAARSAAPVPARSMGDNVVQIFKALGDPTRLDMVRLIGSLGEYPCIALEHALPVGKSTISYHIKILNHAGLVSIRRQGRNFYYALHSDVLEFYVPGLLERLADDPLPKAAG